MSTIAVLTSTETGANSLTDINANYAALNADKAETSAITESAQDAVGAMVDSTLVYVDATPLLTRAALTGDITAPQASNATTLATVNSNVGSFGTATQAGTFTVNGKGLITAASNTTVTPAVGSITGLGTSVATALGVNVGTAGAPVVNGGVLGTPSSGTLTNCTGLPAASIVAGTLATGTYLLSENGSLGLDPAGSADGKYTGITVTGTGGATIAFGDLITLDKDDSRWELVDISVAAAATGDARGLLGMAVSSSTDGTPVTVLLHGIIRADANFPTLTIGAAAYASTTGDVVVAQPTTTDYVIRQVGFGMTADEMYFAPTQTWTTHT